MTDSETKSGFVAIIGRPNVGKSTLLNALVGKKISITTPKPQTTRFQVWGIKSLDETQIIYIDTPGMHQDEKHAMNRYMNRIADSAITDADVIVFMIDALNWHTQDENVLIKLKDATCPVILLINKIDLLNSKEQILPLIDKLKNRYHFLHIIPVSAINRENTDALEQEIIKLLPEGPFLFPDDQVTDKSLAFQCAEIIREKIMRTTEEEIPYSTTVVIEKIKQEEKFTSINALIYVEREGQKAIVIGKAGAKLKKIGIDARRDIENIVKQKVFLRLWVKVKSNWSQSDEALKNLGYE